MVQKVVLGHFGGVKKLRTPKWGEREKEGADGCCWWCLCVVVCVCVCLCVVWLIFCECLGGVCAILNFF